jgi:hypothetical protein
MHHAGGCLCGTLRFASSVDPIDTGYCHCRMCQKLSGAPVLAWASFAAEQLSYVKGRPKIYRSSAHGQREFCEECGSQIAFRSIDVPGTVEINIGTLDDPANVPPQFHIWCGSRIAWFDTDDDLPRFPESEPKSDRT